MKYGEHEYGLLQYGISDIQEEVTPEVEDFVDLEKYVPPFILEMPEFEAWLRSQGYEVGREWAYKAMLVRQIYADTVDTAEGCRLWENMLGITASEDTTIKQRRDEILAKLRSGKTCTPELLKNIVETLTGVECQIVEVNNEYRFIVRFVGQYGVVKRAKVVARVIEEIKPAHLGYTIEYRYVLWRELLPYTWDQIHVYTWDGLRIMGIITRVTWHGLFAAAYSWRGVRNESWKSIKRLEDAKE